VTTTMHFSCRHNGEAKAFRRLLSFGQLSRLQPMDCGDLP
jgi:hypothetical protein